MKLFLFLLSLSFCSIVSAQKAREWKPGGPLTKAMYETEAAADGRLLPCNGHMEKNATMLAADQEFIDDVMKMDRFKGDKRAASNGFIGLGFDYLYKDDLRTAMYRFNQAYLLDSTNPEIYWGYGSFYFYLGFTDRMAQQFKIGLEMEPNNVNMLTDLGTSYYARYLEYADAGDEKIGKIYLDSAQTVLEKAVKLDPKHVNAAYKISITYMYQGDCDKATEFYKIAKELKCPMITPEFEADLKKVCKKK